MRHLTKLITIFILTSCADSSHKETVVNVPDNSKAVTINLRDSLGTLSFSMPLNFDTSFTWTNHSDCGKPCDHEEYRFQPKTVPIFKESGFMYTIPDIDINQFTIIHSGYFPFHDGADSSKNSVFLRHFKEQFLSDTHNGRILYDTIEKINDRYFSIIGMTGFDTTRNRHFAKVASSTTIKSNLIEFDFDVKTKDTIDTKEFFDKSIRHLRTIQIGNGI